MACPSGVLVEEKDVLWKDKSTKAVFRRTERETMLNLAFVSIRHHSWQISHNVEVADPCRIEALGSNPSIFDESARPPKTDHQKVQASQPRLFGNSSKSAPSSISSTAVIISKQDDRLSILTFTSHSFLNFKGLFCQSLNFSAPF